MDRKVDFATGDGNTIARSARSGLMWLTGSRVVEQIVSFAITAILARLLMPADYGLLGMALVVLALLSRFADFGTGSAIIQKHDLGATKLSSIFWLNVIVGVVLAGFLILASPLVAVFFNEPEVQPVVAVLALTLPLQALAIAPDFLLRRQLRFSRVALRNQVAVIAGGTVGIAVALMGGGVWALVAQRLTQSLVALVVLWLAVSWRPVRRFSVDDIREIGGFTSGVVGFNFLNYLVSNMDYLLIGRFLGPASLGLYTLAFRLMRYPVTALSSVTSQTLFPVFSRMGDDQKRISSAYLRVVQYISLLTFPIMIGMALTAEDLINTLFGTQWLDAAPLLVFLALGALLQPASSLYTSVVWARGHTQWHLKYAAIQAVLVVSGFVVGLQWGVEGVAAAYMVTAFVSSLITIIVMFPKCDVSRMAFGRAIKIPIIGVLAMTTAIFLGRYVLEAHGLLPGYSLGRLVIDVLLGSTVYVATVLLVSPKLRHELYDELKVVLDRQ